MNWLNNIKNKVHDWCNANLLSINEAKTTDIKFGLRCPESPAIRFLGIHLESSLGWGSHVDSIAGKMCRGLYLMRTLKNNICNEVLITVYYGHVHSHLNYGILLWGGHPAANKLFVLQKRAIRLICGVNPLEHCKPLFTELGILTQPSMYVLACLLYVKLNINNFTTRSQLHNYPTRNNYKLNINKCQYSTTQKNFKYTSVKLYNELPEEIRNLSYATFRRVVIAALRANPLYKINEFYNLRLF